MQNMLAAQNNYHNNPNNIINYHEMSKLERNENLHIANKVFSDYYNNKENKLKEKSPSKEEDSTPDYETLQRMFNEQFYNQKSNLAQSQNDNEDKSSYENIKSIPNINSSIKDNYKDYKENMDDFYNPKQKIEESNKNSYGKLLYD